MIMEILPPIGRCVECSKDDLYLDCILLDNFSLSVCVTCKQDQTHRNGTFELVSKTRARAEYALPESCFYGLPYLRKPNPRHEAFAPVQLYLRRTLIQEAHRRYGGQEGLEAEKQKRSKRVFEVAAKRTKHLLKRKRLIELDNDVEQLEEDKKRKKRHEEMPVEESAHCHDFQTETFDEKTASWTKSCECGMHVQFERW